jgi:DNA-binding response OmpR family regulator
MADKILLVDDNADFALLLSVLLKQKGYQTVSVQSAENALEELRITPYDLVVLDLNLPGLSGMKTCQLIKQNPATTRVPVLMLTGMDDKLSKVDALRIGADDYLVKSPDTAEFTARVEALIRRSKYASVPGKVTEEGEVRVDMDRYEVFVQGKPVKLRPKELQILHLLMEKNGRVMSRKAIFESLWGDRVVTEHTLEVHINNLREKLGPCAAYLQTITSAGYKFQKPA